MFPKEESDCLKIIPHLPKLIPDKKSNKFLVISIQGLIQIFGKH